MCLSFFSAHLLEQPREARVLGQHPQDAIRVLRAQSYIAGAVSEVLNNSISSSDIRQSCIFEEHSFLIQDRSLFSCTTPNVEYVQNVQDVFSNFSDKTKCYEYVDS